MDNMLVERSYLYRFDNGRRSCAMSLVSRMGVKCEKKERSAKQLLSAIQRKSAVSGGTGREDTIQMQLDRVYAD